MKFFIYRLVSIFPRLKSANVCEAFTKVTLIMLMPNQRIVKLQNVWEPKLLAV